PPAWKDVWICPWPNGHIQATGVDAAGRRQYRYHDEWRARRDAEKHERVLEIARQLPDVRDAVVEALSRKGLTRERVRAAGTRVWHDVTSTEINNYLKELSGAEITAKDFRTWTATVLMAATLAGAPAPTSRTARKRAVKAAYELVSEQLGNTPAVCKASYVDP